MTPEFSPGKFRSELKLACPSIKTDDVEWIVAYFTSALASHAPSSYSSVNNNPNYPQRNGQQIFPASEAAAQPTRDDLINLLKRISTDIGQTIIEDPIRAADGWAMLSAPVISDIQAAIEACASCRNPNHAMTDGSRSPHEIGPSCMADIEPDH